MRPKFNVKVFNSLPLLRLLLCNRLHGGNFESIYSHDAQSMFSAMQVGIAGNRFQVDSRLRLSADPEI